MNIPSQTARIYLSPPHLSGHEERLIADALASNWIAPLGPHVDQFEREFAQKVGVPHAAALASGTAALHLALLQCGVGPGDVVLCSTFTFAASANAIVYCGGSPVFVDADEASWNLDPDLVREELASCAARGVRPKAVVAVDLYGQVADMARLEACCAEFGVALIEDAAEALGSTYKSRSAGSFGRAGVFSFNGNKIITTSGGGMLVSHDGELIREARRLAAQARDPAPHYEHSVIGFNYRMSNILAALGRAQLLVLEERVAARRANFAYYQSALADVPGLAFMPETSDGRANRWLTCLTLDPRDCGATREDVRAAMESENIEARPLWKPLHLQPVFSGCRVRGGSVAEAIFERGICLPSGSSLRSEDLARVAGIVRRCAGGGPQGAVA